MDRMALARILLYLNKRRSSILDRQWNSGQEIPRSSNEL